MTKPIATIDRLRPATGARAAGAPGLVLAFVCVAQFIVFLNVSGVSLALPSIQDDLGMSDVSLNYVVTAYATVLGGFLLLGGRLADTFGRRGYCSSGSSCSPWPRSAPGSRTTVPH
jgi:MFS family permease